MMPSLIKYSIMEIRQAPSSAGVWGEGLRTTTFTQNNAQFRCHRGFFRILRGYEILFVIRDQGQASGLCATDAVHWGSVGMRVCGLGTSKRFMV